jgi:hypothetical protein
MTYKIDNKGKDKTIKSINTKLSVTVVLPISIMFAVNIMVFLKLAGCVSGCSGRLTLKPSMDLSQ